MNRPTTFLALAASLAFCAGGVSFGTEPGLEAELAQTRDQLWQAREQLWQARNDILDKNRQIDELRASSSARPEDGELARERILRLENALASVAQAVKAVPLLSDEERAAVAFDKDKLAGDSPDGLAAIDQQGSIVADGVKRIARHWSETRDELEQTRTSLTIARDSLAAAHARNTQLQRDLDAQNDRVREQDTALAALEEEKALLAAQLEKCTAAQEAAPRLQPDTQGKIVSVNSNWNFVIVDIGANQGATIGAELLVSRGDTFLGKIRLVEIQDDLSIAEFLPGTQPHEIQEGDDVLF